MRCKNCGSPIDHGLICPLCGHKNIGVTTCPVCDKKILPGQEYCSSCGSPTPYRRDISIRVSNQSFSSDKHSTTSHQYTIEEGYDYQSDAYTPKKVYTSIKKKANTFVNNKTVAQKKRTRYTKPVTRRKSKGSSIKVLLFTLIIVSALIPILVGTFVSLFDDFDFSPSDTSIMSNSGLVDEQSLSDFTLQDEVYSSYRFGEGKGYYYNGDLYLAGANNIYVFYGGIEGGRLLNQQVFITDTGYASNLYVDKNYIYYYHSYNNSYNRVKLDTGEEEELVYNGNDYQVVGNVLYYTNDEKQLCSYHMKTYEEKRYASDVSINKFYYHSNGNIYIDSSSGVGILNPKDNSVEYLEGDIEYGSHCIFLEDSIYCTLSNKLVKYDLTGKVLKEYDLKDEDVYVSDYYPVANGIVVYDYYNGIIFLDENTGKAKNIYSKANDIYEIEVHGEHIFFLDNHEYYWYIMDLDGNYACLDIDG